VYGKSKADEEESAQQKIINADKKHFQILKDKQKAIEIANREIKEQARVRLETIQKEFKSTGIISKEGIKLLIAEINKEKEIYIQNTQDKVTAERIAQAKILALREKVLKATQEKNKQLAAAEIEAGKQIVDLNLIKLQDLKKNQDKVNNEIAVRNKKREENEMKLVLARAKTMKDLNLERLKGLKTVSVSPVEVPQTELDKYIDSLNESLDATTMLEKATVSAFKNMEDSLVNYIMTGKTGFKEFAYTAVQELTRIFVRQQLIAPIAGAFKNSNLFSSIGSTISSLFHSGGVVGQPTQQRVVNPVIFNNAPKFHDGLLPGEYPAILKQGETVRTVEQEAALHKDNAPIVNINIENKKSDAQVTTTQPFMDEQGRLTIGIVIDALQRNVGGLRDVTRSVVAAR
jgi:hypothetical protein